MTEIKANSKHWLRLSYILRRPQRAVSQKVKPSLEKEQISSILESKQSISTYLSSDLSQQKSLEIQQTTSTTALSPTNDIDIIKAMRTPTPTLDKCSSLTPEINNLNEAEQSENFFLRWFHRLTIKQQITFKILTIFLLISSITIITFVPVYFVFIRPPNQQSSFTNITVSTCSATTCIGKETPYRTSIATAIYPFDYNTNDLTGYATGTPLGSTIPGFTTACYVGTGSLNLNINPPVQYVQIPYVNLGQSFTIEAWLYPSNLALPDYGIFSQCDLNSNCLSISLRNSRFTISFDSMNVNNYTLFSTYVPPTGDWVHLTVVYDAVLYQQQIYVNGRIDGISRGIVAPFAGSSTGSTTTIGRTVSFAYGVTYFQGRIDHFIISAGVARTACQIYNDVTLLAYFPFDTTATLNDYSVNIFNGIASGTTTISQGRSGQALYFSSATSYFQAKCYPHLENSNPPFTFALWVNPDTSNGGGSLIHASNYQNGSGSNCYDLLSITSTGALVVQLMQNIALVNAFQGPVIPVNTWTHIAIVYNSAYGVRIHINGQLSTVSPNVGISILGYNEPQYITLGNNSPLGPSGSIICLNGSIPIVPGPYKGAIDDFRIYNRELDNQEICMLANI